MLISIILQSLALSIAIAVIFFPTFLIIKNINQKGEAGLIAYRFRVNRAIIFGIISFFIPFLNLIITLPLLFIGRAQMRWSGEDGWKASTVFLYLCFIPLGLVLLNMPKSML